MEETGRSYLVGVRISAQEKEALRRRAGELNTSQSALAYRLMRQGNLDTLVAFYFGPDASDNTHEDVSKNGGDQ